MRKIISSLLCDLRWRLLLLAVLLCAPLVGSAPPQPSAWLVVAAGLAGVFGCMSGCLLIPSPFGTLVCSSPRLAAGSSCAKAGLFYKGNELGQLARTCDQMGRTLEIGESAHQSANHALKMSEMRYRRLFETARDGILILNADTGQIEDANPFLTGLLGYTHEEMMGKKLWEIGPFKDTKVSQADFRQLQREAYIRYEDLPLETSAGKSIHVEFISNVYEVNGGKVIQCNVRDITERHEAEEKRKEYSAKLQVLSRRLVEAQESERRNIARELHDEIGQALTVIQLNLQSMLQSPSVGGLAGRLKQSLQLAEGMLKQVQDICLNLRPSVLDDLGLEPALRWYANRQAALVEIKVHFHADGLQQRCDPVIETECFRVAQEALTNVARHARARSVTVELHIRDGRLCLSVSDDGVGFAVACVREQAVRGASLGLLSMEERVALAGGGFEIRSAPGRGTQVKAWFPVKWLSLPSASASL